MDHFKCKGIAELSAMIHNDTQKVIEYLHTRGLPFPSFDIDAPTKSMITPEDSEIEAARLRVIDASEKLQALMLGPQDYLQSFTVSCYCQPPALRLCSCEFFSHKD